jgi:dTDP-4-dehydrorhamnose reductase
VFRVLVLGAGGMLARDVLAQAPRDIDLVPRTSRELDITNREAVSQMVNALVPDVVINCAAYTDVDEAETNQSRALLVNGEAPGIVAAALAERQSTGNPDPLLIHYGSDYVFDGSGSRPYREDDPPAPLGAYGASKLAGEVSIAERGRRYLVLRTQWLYGVHGRSFPRTMWERATAGQRTKVVNDQTGRPTYTVDLARATWQLLSLYREQVPGSRPLPPKQIVHVTNGGNATWYDIAVHVFRRAGRTELLTPCTTAEFPRPARRPVWSVLDTTRFEQLAGCAMPDWRDALDRFLDELEGARPRP